MNRKKKIEENTFFHLDWINSQWEKFQFNGMLDIYFENLTWNPYNAPVENEWDMSDTQVTKLVTWVEVYFLKKGLSKQWRFINMLSLKFGRQSSDCNYPLRI